SGPAPSSLGVSMSSRAPRAGVVAHLQPPEVDRRALSGLRLATRHNGRGRPHRLRALGIRAASPRRRDGSDGSSHVGQDEGC
ncbi:MAG: hypothetical protein ACO3I0_00295, partial [Limisphaerales bacterium]